MGLSIRATGLLAILQMRPHLLGDATNLHAHFPENKDYVQGTLKVLEKSDSIRIQDNVIQILKPICLTESTPKPPSALETRIFSLFTANRTYEKIAWFLDQLEKTFDLDTELSERVCSEYKAGAVVQFWTDYHIDQAMKRALVDKSIGNVTMNDLLDLLRKRDKGELVWQK